MVVKRFGYQFRPGSDRSQSIVERDANALSPSYTRSYGLVMDHGKGALLWDKEGNKYIDFAAGIAVMSTGYGHPRILQTIHEQAERFLHVGGTDFFYEEQVLLAEKLQRIIPIHGAERLQDKRVFLANSGTETIEAALKLARYQNPRRSHVIAFYGAFHGRSMGALSVTASKAIQRENYPFIPGGVVHVPYPGKFEYEHSQDPRSLLHHPAEFIERFVFAKKVPPTEVAAIIVEPIQGEGGYIIPTDDFLPELRALCDRHGILLIVDEIQSGMGRTGRWLAVEHWDVQPDIVCMAKGLGSGFPVGAVIAHKDVMQKWVPGAHASTFGGNPLACQVASATIDIIEDEGLLPHVTRIGAMALERLQRLPDRFPFIRRVEGKGLMIGVEFAGPQGDAMPHFRDQVVDECFMNGLVTLGCGSSTLRIAPPLIIDENLMMQGLDILEQSLAQVVQRELAGSHADASEDVHILIVGAEPDWLQWAHNTLADLPVPVQIQQASSARQAAQLAGLDGRYQVFLLDTASIGDSPDTLMEAFDMRQALVVGCGSTLSYQDVRELLQWRLLDVVIGKDEPDAKQILLDAVQRHLRQRKVSVK